MTRTGISEAKPRDPDDEEATRSDGGLSGPDEPDNPLKHPTPAAKAAQGHEFGAVSGARPRKQSDIPYAVGDPVVNVRGPDERELTAGGGEYLTATFNFRDRERAVSARAQFMSGEGGRQKATAVSPPQSKRLRDKSEYFSIEVSVPITPETTAKELERDLRARKASDVRGPFREPGRKRFELVFQHRSGNTDTRLYKTREAAEEAKAEAEQRMRNEPIKGVVPRRVAPGASTRTQRAPGYFSDQSSQERKHAALLRKMPAPEARAEIATELGYIDKKTGKVAADKEGDLDRYITSLKGKLGGARGSDLDKLRPTHDGSFVGQRHAVRGQFQRYGYSYIDKKTGELKRGSGQRAGRSSVEFLWDGEEWLTPVELSAKKRGERLPTQSAPERGPTGGKPFGPSQSGERPTPSKKRIGSDDPRYTAYYVKALEAVGRHYSQSPITQGMGEAMLGVVRVTRSKGSPTHQSLDKLAQSVLDLEELMETRGNALTPRGRENLEAAINAGRLILRQTPPAADDFGPEPDVGPEPRGPGWARPRQGIPPRPDPRAEPEPEEPDAHPGVAGDELEDPDEWPRDDSGGPTPWTRPQHRHKAKLARGGGGGAAPSTEPKATPEPTVKGSIPAPADAPWRALQKMVDADDEDEPSNKG